MRSVHLALVTVLLAGCGGDPDCQAGFEARDDGLCYQAAASDDPDAAPDDTLDVDDPDWIEVFVASLPACTATSGDGALDLDRGCVGDACAGDTFAELEAALGAPTSCTRIYLEFGAWTFEYARCDWPGGVSAELDEVDEDGWPVPDSVADWMAVGLPSVAATADGIGIGAEFSCFVDRFGMPSYLSFSYSLIEGWVPRYMSYGALTLQDSYGNDDASWGSDGRVDSITLY